MLISQLTIATFPILHLEDKVSFALQLLEEYDISHLPVINNEKYIGLVSKDDLLDADEKALLQSLEHDLFSIAVKQQDHFLTALRLVATNQLTLLPVITSEQELLGVLAATELLQVANEFTGGNQEGAIIVLEMDRINYSFGELSRLIETNDASIMQLNTSVNPTNNQFTVTIKINKLEVSDVVSTLQRYDYNIVHYIGEEAYQNELRENYNLLMTYLKI